MKNGELVSIGEINMYTIRDYIIENRLGEYSTINLHFNDFDKIVLEYRRINGTSLKIPYFIFDTLVQSDPMKMVSNNKIRVVINDNRLSKNQLLENNNDEDDIDTIYDNYK